MEVVLKKINVTGLFWLILAVEEGEMLVEYNGSGKGVWSDVVLDRIRGCYVKTTQERAAGGVLLEFCADHPHIEYKFGKYTLSIMDNGSFTTLYISLTKDLYLRF